jgi:ribosomal protein S21
MAINAEVQKSGSENALSTIRKFTRRVQGTGLVRAVRSGRYYERQKSKTVQKKRALKLLKRRAEYLQKVKEGKIIEREIRGQRPNPTMRSSTADSNPRVSGSGLGESTPIAR